MTKLRVSPRSIDKTGSTLYHSKEVRIDGKIDIEPFMTPIVAMDTREVRRTDNIAKAAKGLNEIFRSPPTKLPKNEKDKKESRTLFKDLVFDTFKQHEFNVDIENQVSKLSGLSAFFFEYKDEEYPSEKGRDFILDTEYSYSDIPCLPITPNVVNNIKSETDFQKYLTFIRGCIEYLQGFNEKPIMGIIPNIAHGYMADLIELYVERGIHAFCIDFDCHTPMSHKPALTKCYRVLKDHEQFENSLFYGLNINSGRFIKNQSVITAKDILSFGFGLDAMGKRHRNKIDFKKIKEKMGDKWQQLDRSENKVRLFIKGDYGYHKAQAASQITDYPLDSSIPISTFTQNFSVQNFNMRHSEKIFNMEQLGLEASRLRSIIKDDSPVTYLSGKAFVDEKDIKLIKGFKDGITKFQATLDERL